MVFATKLFSARYADLRHVGQRGAFVRSIGPWAPILLRPRDRLLLAFGDDLGKEGNSPRETNADEIRQTEAAPHFSSTASSFAL